MQSPRIKHALGEVTELTDEEFREIWELNPQGDIEGSYIAVVYAIRYKQFLDGSPVTFKELKRRYQLHVEENMRRPTGAKYISRLNNWVNQAKYNHEYGKPNDPRKNRYI